MFGTVAITDFGWYNRAQRELSQGECDSLTGAAVVLSLAAASGFEDGTTSTRSLSGHARGQDGTMFRTRSK